MVKASQERVKLHRIHGADNVATAICDLKEGESLDVDGVSVTVRSALAFGHKVALRDIPEGSEVIKYGEPIGRAKRNIAMGEHVHVHNVVTLRGIRTDVEDK